METTDPKQAIDAANVEGKAFMDDSGIPMQPEDQTPRHSAHFNATWNVYLDLWTDYLQHQIKESQCRNPTDNSRTI